MADAEAVELFLATRGNLLEEGLEGRAPSSRADWILAGSSVADEV
jgi:hypothetical protein